MRHALASVSALALTTAPLFAQEDVYELPTLLLDVGYEATTPLQTGVAVEVITEEELEEDGDTRVLDILARQPGVSIRSNGPLGTNAGVSIRGVSQQNIAVRVDGIDVSDPSGTQVAFDFGGLTAGDISQIEIVRGSQSARYGSEAIGGAINITTKRASRDGLSAEAFAEYGSYETLRSAVTLFNRGEGHETAVTLSYVRSDGFSAADENDGNDEEDGFEARRLSFSGTYDLGDGAAQLELSGFTQEAQYDYDEAMSGMVYDGSPDDVTDVEDHGLRAALSFSTGLFDHEVSASWYDITRTLTGTSSGSDFRYRYEGTRHEYRYQAGFDLSPTTRAVAGIERTIEDYADNTRFGTFPASSQEQDSTVDSLFAELTMKPTSDIDLSLTVRHDDHSEYGGFTTGRLSGVWRIRPDLSLRANLANGYRAPSNYELYDVYSGNSGLDPETSKSFDIGIEKSWGDAAWLSATAFVIEAEDIIDYSYTSYAYVQRDGTSTRQGVELSGGTELRPGLTLDGSYTWTDSWSTASLDSSGWQSSVPEHSLALGLHADLTDRARLSVTGRYEADRSGLDDYGLVNSTVTYDVTDSTQAYLRVENLFDEEYQTVPGYGQSDRAWYFGVRASF
ncbi:MAG: TonB-dependent receptor [Rhodobacteraceae bacterium]|jgi:vitamin B12 transporter|uniref:Vitamin B12 transporter n=1 Tax=Salipiger profundus TaxID=1229727 RepID=A0A1U7CZS4_9RHOB|nr:MULTISPECIES: TonB-dependent receptor [Salipiger]APX21335.1 vitamin B12 transporter [Salipiger profundus]MAB08745.1 TonB-dependent receptor [Paracoccaceae bacterium]GGA03196.1 TonB-dependent receptor [Salipiger profundus]SFC25058.1 vitamin B12 transporter [Salipiger profundus]